MERTDGQLSIHKTTNPTARSAFARVGFPDVGKTGASIDEVLGRAARWARQDGHAQLASRISDFIAETWPDLDVRSGTEGAMTNPPKAVVAPASDDAVTESSEVDDEEVEALHSQALRGDFAVPDQYLTARTRGSAQRVFADSVKTNYDWTCALTGIHTPAFLVASHIVPWSEDESIRLDPANGICLSTFADRAFDEGYLLIHDDCTVHVDWIRVGADDALRAALRPFDGQNLRPPATSPPNPEFLRRRLSNSGVDQ